MASASVIRAGREKSAASDTTSVKSQTAPAEATAKRESVSASQDSQETSANKVNNHFIIETAVATNGAACF